MGALLTRYFDAEVAGLERAPAGAALLVGNHNAGTATPDSFVFGHAWLARFGEAAVPVSLGHDLLFRVPLGARLASQLSIVPAKHGYAEEALSRGRKVLVYPGGQHEALRPSRDRDRIDFGGHRGYVRLALRCGVPIVPVVAAGAHDGWYVVSRGDAIGRRWPLRRWLRLETAPLAFGLPTGVVFPYWPHLPLPRKMLIELLDPITLAGDPRDPEAVAAGDLRVREAMQRALDRLVGRLPRSQR